jgi:hypothetical protein
VFKGFLGELLIGAGVLLIAYYVIVDLLPTLQLSSGGVLANALTGNLTTQQQADLNTQLTDSIITAGGSESDAAAAVAQQNAYIANHPPTASGVNGTTPWYTQDWEWVSGLFVQSNATDPTVVQAGANAVLV